jgi:hypothetical protein
MSTSSPTGRPYRHIALFQLQAGVSDEQRDEAVDLLRSVGEHPGVVQWTVELSLDQRKGTIIVENGLFDGADSFEAWRTWDHHRTVAAHMSGIADWLIGDYLER